MSQASSRRQQKPAAFFDRDGVLNVDAGYAHRVDQITLVPGAAEAVRLCNQAGYHVFIVSNQSGVARGLFDEEAVRAFNRALIQRLAASDARVDDVRYCPHHPDASVDAYRQKCDCRKPRAGMILDLMRAWSVDRSRSFLIGDKDIDLEAARAANITGVLYSGGPLDGLVAPLLTALQS